MIYLPKPEQAWRRLSADQKKRYPLETMKRDLKRSEEKYPQPNVVYLDIGCFDVWDATRTNGMEVL
jgi:hypothetical protein